MGRAPQQLTPGATYGCQQVVGPAEGIVHGSRLWLFRCIHCKAESTRIPWQVINGPRNSCACRAGRIPPNGQRDAQIRQLRSEGKTLAEIGRMLGVSRQRICQILKSVDSTKSTG